MIETEEQAMLPRKKFALHLHQKQMKVTASQVVKWEDFQMGKLAHVSTQHACHYKTAPTYKLSILQTSQYLKRYLYTPLKGSSIQKGFRWDEEQNFQVVLLKL